MLGSLPSPIDNNDITDQTLKTQQKGRFFILFSVKLKEVKFIKKMTLKPFTIEKRKKI